MGKQKVLITGAKGQLGQDLVEVFKENWEVVPADHENLDITNVAQTNEVIHEEKPDWIIHSAAWTDVEGCAEKPEKALLINGEGTKNVAEAAKKIGAKMVYISTNEVFDGKKKEPYIETDRPNPINSYGVSKLAGEKYTQEILGKGCMVVRSSWLYGPKGKLNFPVKIINVADQKGELLVTADEVATPTYTPNLANALNEIIKKNGQGIFHLVNEGYCSRYDWAEKILEASHRVNVPVEPMKLSDYPRKSVPPEFSALSNTRAKKLGIGLQNWETGVEEFFKQRKDLVRSDS